MQAVAALRLVDDLRLLAADCERVVCHLDRQLLLVVAGNLDLEHELVGRLEDVGRGQQRRREADVLEHAPQPPFDRAVRDPN